LPLRFARILKVHYPSVAATIASSNTTLTLENYWAESLDNSKIRVYHNIAASNNAVVN